MSVAIRLGTRGSDLALAQAAMVRAALESAHAGIVVEQKIVKTIGDKRPDLKLSEFGEGEQPVVDKGIFTRELEIALEAGEIDMAVHSLKDVPTELEPQFAIAAVLPRAAVQDVLICKSAHSLAQLPAGATVATSSVRRKCLLEWMRPDLEIVDIRGNVPTRIRKLVEGDAFDAIMLARAGLDRLGYAPSGVLAFEGVELPVEIMDEERFLPAAGQGAVGIEIRSADRGTAAMLGPVNDADTLVRVTLEREFLHLLQAGCQTPVGMLTRIDGENTLSAKAVVFEDGIAEPRSASVSGSADSPRELAAALLSDLK